MTGANYTAALRAVSELLYEIDPYEMGSSLDAPRDEYDEFAARLMAALRPTKTLDEASAELARRKWVLDPDLLQQICTILDGAGLHNPYTSLETFEAIYLEDSFVLDVVARPGRVTFEMDLVLTPQHAEYAPPLRGEQHCYRRGTIDFENVRSLTWRKQGSSPSRDASGEIDYGNIDSMSVADGVYLLEGDWGEIEVQSEPPTVHLQ